MHDALGTTKNPYPTLASPHQKGKPSGRNDLVDSNYDILLDAAREGRTVAVDGDKMRVYLDAGFALSDYYCDLFFRDADESQRRRRFGRAFTNDAGTAISTILGLANAGQNVVTGVAAGFGFGDNLWRNYDDAFVVAPDLSNVQALVSAAQDNFRGKTLGKDAKGVDIELPKTYGKAQSVIMRYANLCSTLGMRALLSQSADAQRTQLQDKTREENNPAPVAPPPVVPAPVVPAPVVPAAPSSPQPEPVEEPRAAPQALPG